jgi:hypothetical protein
MEPKGEEGIIPTHFFESGTEFAFGHSEGMAQMEFAIHVWVRECHHVLWFAWVHFSFESFFFVPDLLGFSLDI